MPKRTSTKVYGPSKTIPGQSLYPADLMKRHLAGTLPPIDLSKKYEYHYDEQGNQTAEPMPTEMYEIHALAVALRKQRYEAMLEERKQQAIKERDNIIAEYRKQQREKAAAAKSHPNTPDGSQVTPPKTPATPPGSHTKKKG